MPTTLATWLAALQRAHHHLPALEHIVWPGRVDDDGRPVSAHGVDVQRLIWAHLHKTPRPAFRIEAACDEPACLRPSHLRDVPVRPLDDARLILATHCRHGHDLTDWRNAYWTRGRRRCRPCDRKAGTASLARLRVRTGSATMNDPTPEAVRPAPRPETPRIATPRP